MSQKSYEQLVQRVQRVIGSPAAQSKNCAEIQRQPDDSPEDWARIPRRLQYPCRWPLAKSGQDSPRRRMTTLKASWILSSI